jgi:hypothetical protein
LFRRKEFNEMISSPQFVIGFFWKSDLKICFDHSEEFGYITGMVAQILYDISVGQNFFPGNNTL